MTKTELIEQISGDAGISKTEAGEALNSFVEGIQGALKKSGSKVTLTGFGTFANIRKNARKGRNPSTGEEITIEARNVIKFKAGKTLKEAIN